MFSENSYLSPRARRLASGRRRGREGPASDPHPLECGLAAGVTLSLGTDLQLLADGRPADPGSADSPTCVVLLFLHGEVEEGAQGEMEAPKQVNTPGFPGKLSFGTEMDRCLSELPQFCTSSTERLWALIGGRARKSREMLGR